MVGRSDRIDRLDEIISTLWFHLKEQRYSVFVSQLVIDMMFCDEIMNDPIFYQDLDSEKSPLHRLFNRLLDVGIESFRNFILINLASKCLQVWWKNAASAGSYADEMVRLFLIREAEDNICNAPDEEPTEGGGIGIKDVKSQLTQPVIR